MPCDIAAIKTAACVSEIGELTDEIELLQAIAQSALDWAEANNPGVDYSLSAVKARACTSGIGRETNEVVLYRLIGQNVCNMIS